MDDDAIANDALGVLIQDPRGHKMQLVLVALQIVDGVPSIGATLSGTEHTARSSIDARVRRKEQTKNPCPPKISGAAAEVRPAVGGNADERTLSDG